MVAYEPPLSLLPEPERARMYTFRRAGDGIPPASAGPLRARSSPVPVDDLSA
jgi:hypothetical protein